MKYQQRTFSLAMPGAKVRWPFKKSPTMPWLSYCPRCDAHQPNGPHVDARDETKVRKRICFGK